MNNFQENTNPDESIATIKRDNQELLNEDKTKKIENENQKKEINIQNPHQDEEVKRVEFQNEKKENNNEVKERIFNEMRQQRKIEGFSQFKHQDENLKKVVADHKVNIEIIFQIIDKRVKLSDTSFTGVIGFFKERQQMEVNNHKIFSNKQPGYDGIFKDQDTVLYPKLCKTLSQFSELNQKHSQSILKLSQDLNQFIETKLVQDQNAYGKMANEYRQNQIKLKKKINEMSQNTLKYYQKLGRLYSEMMNNNGIHKKRSKDLFYSEKKYKLALNQQLNLQDQLGQLTDAYWNDFIRYESMRLEIIQDAFEYYLIRLNETYAGNKGGATVQLIIKDIKELRPVLEVQQSFNMKTQLNTVQLQSIFLGLNLKPGVEVDDDKIKQYLSNLKLIQPQLIQNHPFIIKSFNRIQRDVGTIMSNYKPLLLAVTLDKHILGFDTDDGTVPDSKPVCKYVLENTDLIQKSKHPNVVAELKHTIPGMIFDSKQSILLKFISHDEFEELSFYIGQYKKKQ